MVALMAVKSLQPKFDHSLHYPLSSCTSIDLGLVCIALYAVVAYPGSRFVPSNSTHHKDHMETSGQGAHNDPHVRARTSVICGHLLKRVAIAYGCVGAR